jgi:hypothetical protein
MICRYFPLGQAWVRALFGSGEVPGSNPGAPIYLFMRIYRDFVRRGAIAYLGHRS